MAPHCGLGATGSREPTPCVSRSRTSTSISLSAFSNASPAFPRVDTPRRASSLETPRKSHAAAERRDEQLFRAGVPRILALLERVAAGQRRIEARLGGAAPASGTPKGRGAGCLRGETEIPMSHLGSSELSIALDAASRRGSDDPPSLDGIPLQLAKAYDVFTPGVGAAATGSDWKEGLLLEDLPVDEEVALQGSLKSSWPGSLQIREVLASESPQLRRMQTQQPSKRPSLAVVRLSHMSGGGGDSWWWRGSCMVDPSSRLLMAWHFLSAVVLLYDLIMIPYALAWDVHFSSGVFFLGGWVHSAFWVMDIMLTFRTGYYNRAELVLDTRKVAAHYLSTWFVVDAMLVLCDVISMLAETGRGFMLLRMSKLARILRIAGVLRIYRLVQIIKRKISHDEYQLTGKIVSMILQMVAFNHVTSCAWFAVGTYAPTDTGERWVNDLKVSSQEDLYEYITSLHWSVAHFTLGGTDIVCTNSVERAFTICFLLLGLVWSSTIISSLSASAIDFNIRRSETQKKVRQVAQFFREHRIDRRVAQQVHEQVRARLARKESLVYGDVEAFSLLSTSVQRRLMYELIKPYFRREGLFRLWSRMDQTTVHEICHHACEYKHLMAMDDLFLPSVLAKGIHYVAGGALRYTQSPTSSPVEEETVEQVPAGTWVSEAALWTHWTHVGTAEAVVPSQLLVMNGDALGVALQNSFLVRQVTMAYCQQFYRSLLAAQPPRRQWPNDLRVPFTDFATLVMGMDSDMQEVLSLDAIEQLYVRGNTKLPSLKANVDTLSEEVRNGTAVVVLNAANELERLVSEVSLLIQDDEERMLVQVARQEATKIVVDRRLPYGKQMPGEEPEAAVQRLLRAELAFLEGRASLGVLEQQGEEVKMKRYAKYTLSTKCVRTVCHARLSGRGDRSASDAPVSLYYGGNGRSVMLRPTSRGLASKLSLRRMLRASSRSTMASVRETQATTCPHAGPASPTELLSSISLYSSGDEGKLNFYSWVTESQFQALKETPIKALSDWVQHRHVYRNSQASAFGASSPSASSPRY